MDQAKKHRRAHHLPEGPEAGIPQPPGHKAPKDDLLHPAAYHPNQGAPRLKKAQLQGQIPKDR